MVKERSVTFRLFYFNTLFHLFHKHILSYHMYMTLREYLFHYRITVTEFAKLLGYSRVHLSGVVSGKRTPSKKLLQKILDVTANRVKF